MTPKTDTQMSNVYSVAISTSTCMGNIIRVQDQPSTGAGRSLAMNGESGYERVESDTNAENLIAAAGGMSCIPPVLECSKITNFRSDREAKVVGGAVHDGLFLLCQVASELRPGAR